jgi:MoaA/NifB/PqqE/SkfB family radical SAM enzyme
MERSEADEPPWLGNRRLWQQEFKDGVACVKSKPSWVSLETTAICNLRCVQCPRENPSTRFVETEMDESVAEKFLENLPYVTHLQLFGLGEPLLSKLFWKMIEDYRTKDIDLVDANSNGTLFTERNVDRLLRSNLNFVNVSLDAATPLTYKRIRGGNFEKVIAGTKRLTARRRDLRASGELGRANFRIWMNMTLMVENIRELPLFIELAHEVGVDAVDVWQMNMRSDGTTINWRLTHDEWTFVYDEQHLSNAPALSNEMVRRAQDVAAEKGVRFTPRPDVWLPE